MNLHTQLQRARAEIAVNKTTITCKGNFCVEGEITIGKEYTVLGIGKWMAGPTYRVVNDNGNEADYYQWHFVSINN
jgi:hypothetical protein